MRPAGAGDPYIERFTVETPNFRVHYHGGLEEIAMRVATLAERINSRLQPSLGHRPTQITHIVLLDMTDSANGSASGLPFNRIELFVTAPDDMSPLGDYDDWILELLTHEHAHILHVDNVHGIPALVNAVLGKTWVPNQVQPRWILEGFATAMESQHTGGGRGRSTMFDMFLRADVLEDEFKGLDRLSHGTRRWPRGDLWYLYGGRFFAWLVELYGEGVLAAIATDYGQNPVAWGINRSVRRATGRTYPELYDAWLADLRRRYEAQVQAVRRRGLREGTRLTHLGGGTANPYSAPACMAGGAPALLFYAADGHDVSGLYRLPLGARLEPVGKPEQLARVRGSERQITFTPDCDLIFDMQAPSQQRRIWEELHLLPAGETATFGVEGTVRQLTRGLRARDPDVSPDGRHVVFVTNHAGTTTLRIAPLTRDGQLGAIRALVPSARWEQAYSPRWSPDGRYVAYSAWTTGGYRDVRIVEVATGRFIEIAHDRAHDLQPTWMPNGRRLLFASDRTGISNIHLYDLDTKKIEQVTNVTGGAYMPAVSPDGRTLYYAGYTSEGFDLWGMALEPARFLPALPSYDRPPRPADPGVVRYPVRRYDPLTTLGPRRYELDYGTGTFGRALSVRVSGADAYDLHAFHFRGTYQTELEGLTWNAGYSYGRLPFSFDTSLFRSVVPRGGLSIGGNTQRIKETQFGFTTALSYTLPGVFDSHRMALSYTLSVRDPNPPVGDELDPFAPATELPSSGLLGSVRLAYRYTATQASAWAIGAERGYSFSVSGDFASRVTGSEETLQTVQGRLSTYVPAPWPGRHHHVVASSLGVGASGGSYPGRGFFYTGGFADQDLVEDFQSGIRQSSFILRGYEPAQFIGRSFALLNSEYRFPIWYADRGLSTLPAFLRTLAGAAFVDVGGAFDALVRDDPFAVLHAAVGAEIRTSFTLGYVLGGDLRLGAARGLDDDAEGIQSYFVLGGSF